MREPDAADEGEADEIAEELGPALPQCRHQGYVHRRNGQFEYQQRDRDGQYAVRERIEAVQLREEDRVVLFHSLTDWLLIGFVGHDCPLPRPRSRAAYVVRVSRVP